MDRKRIEQLSKELARISGVQLHPPQAGEEGHTPAGELRSILPPEFFQWRKCPKHGTWLQPTFVPYTHWSCQARGCTFKRAAKMRTKIERTMFRIAKFIEEHG